MSLPSDISDTGAACEFGRGRCVFYYTKGGMLALLVRQYSLGRKSEYYHGFIYPTSSPKPPKFVAMSAEGAIRKARESGRTVYTHNSLIAALQAASRHSGR